jgi:MinD-like ATPase involved in chromosome partitioning or flagellar assembly
MMKKNSFDSVFKDTSSDLKTSGINPPDIIEMVLKHDPEKEEFLRNKLSKFKFKLIFNQFRNNVDPTLGHQFENICSRHFYSVFQFLGNISYDSRIHDAIFSKILYIHKYPHTQSAADLKKIAAQIMSKIPTASLAKDML